MINNIEEKIRANYNLDFESLTLEKNFYILKNDLQTFYFVPYQKDEDVIRDLYQLTNDLINKNIATHTMLLNYHNNLLTNIDDTNYVLLKINFPENHEFNLTDIYTMNKLTILNNPKSKLYRNDWAKLWSEKIDYFEYQVKEIGANKKSVINSLSYYIGMAENAISYVNFTESNIPAEVKNITLARRRIFYPNYAINYLNPLNYVFDLELRDIAEYIKSAFFADCDVFKEIDSLFKNITITSYEAHMFFARLLYPSFYFDVYEKVMNHDTLEDELIYIVKKCDEYEIFLKEIYHYLNNFHPLTPINWLIKNQPE